MRFKDYKIDEFLEDLSSSSPSPGGGSVAGLVAASFRKLKFNGVFIDCK